MTARTLEVKIIGRRSLDERAWSEKIRFAAVAEDVIDEFSEPKPVYLHIVRDEHDNRLCDIVIKPMGQ